MSSSEKASAYLHGLTANYINDPPRYSDVIQINDCPSAPLLEPFSSIFGTATSVQFEWNSSDAELSFLIRDNDGSLQAKGVSTSHNTVVQNVNGLEMLKIIERAPDEENGNIMHTYSVIHKHAAIGTIKFTEKTAPSASLKIFDRHGLAVVVNSLKIGDYAIFRKNLLATPLCHLQMPNSEIYSLREFNVKIIFNPRTNITEEEQLLCTAAAIAFKLAMKQATKVAAGEEKCFVNCCASIFLAIFIGLLVLAFIVLDKWGCEHKKAKGYAGYQNRNC